MSTNYQKIRSFGDVAKRAGYEGTISMLWTHFKSASEEKRVELLLTASRNIGQTLKWSPELTLTALYITNGETESSREAYFEASARMLAERNRKDGTFKRALV
ncbi:MAG: hypothetical protein CMH30_05265 [Micavibrio sp.]|nr:hypothetical protein [Micavibrio sp.]|tara:strand:- start:1827 stop:2135 length:309 start_codon:yes stop_codon:yes gene_type:complete